MPEAVWFTAPRRVEIRSEPARALGPGEVRIGALASGISAGSELLVYAGEAPAELNPDLPTVEGGFGLPVKFGYASVGTVLEVGAGVRDLRSGEPAFALHPHQDELVVPAELCMALPDGLPPEHGLFTANLETAVTVALDAHPRLSEAILVTGQGILGLLATMLLARSGAGPIISVDAFDQRRLASRRAGASRSLSPDEDPVAVAREATDGRGVDLAIEASGNPSAIQTCLDAVAFGGTVVVASWYGAREASLRLGAAFHRRRIRVVSSQVSSLDPALAPRWDRSRRTALVRQLLCELPLADLISHRIPFREAPSAYRLLDESPERCLQVVLTHV